MRICFVKKIPICCNFTIRKSIHRCSIQRNRNVNWKL